MRFIPAMDSHGTKVIPLSSTSNVSARRGLVRSIAEALRRLRNWISRSAPQPEPGENPDRWLGRYGEKLAARFLRREHHYKVLYRNFRAPRGGEVDIVCRDGDTLVFVEVKTRSTTFFGRPAEAVNLEKQQLITRGALAWLRMLDNPDLLFRFDIVEIVMESGQPEFNLIRNAFQLSEHYIY